MKKEWFAAKELTGVAGLPSSPQGINLMARREGWISRRRKGVQGKRWNTILTACLPGYVIYWY